MAVLLILIVAVAAHDGTKAWIRSGSTVAVGTSMTHGDSPQRGVVDNGDLSQLAPVRRPGEVVPFLAARDSGNRVAGDFGDVLVFWANGDRSGRGLPVQHRAIAWVEFDPRTGLFDVPEAGLADVDRLVVPGVGARGASGYDRLTLELPLVVRASDGSWRYPLGQTSGWVTKGDASPYFDQSPAGSTSSATRPAISGLVHPSWVIGKVIRVWDGGDLDRVAAGVAVAVGLAGVVVVLGAEGFPRLPTGRNGRRPA
ncbi:MAG TPA: hypothetical protein VM681_05630 [Candidatus Thermoplasmatota archaeon]|nr:hypothetical protein [Candidatus Thermoplasmatota archaeon]